MSKETIAIDIDDVLSSQIDIFIEFSNSAYGMKLSRADFEAPSIYWGLFESVWGVSEEEAAKRLKEFQDSYVFQQTISQEVKEAVKKLKKAFDLELITSRQAKYAERTTEWLERHLPQEFKGVHFVELWDKGDKRATKATVCKEIGAGYLIDDNAEHCNLAAEAGVHALLFGDFGWNKERELHPGVYRVSGWKEVLEYFDARSGQ